MISKRFNTDINRTKVLPLAASKQTVHHDASQIDFLYPVHKEDGLYIINLLTDIEEPSSMYNVFDVLTVATQQDTVVIKLGTNGGYLTTTMMLIEHIKLCEAEVYIDVYGTVASAGTMLLLGAVKAGAYVRIGDYLEFMIHSYTHGFYAKAHEAEAYYKHTAETLPALFKDLYKGFLTDDEISYVLAGGDMYMGSQEVNKRLDDLTEYSQKEADTAAAEQTKKNEKDFEEYAVVKLKELGYSVSIPKSSIPKPTKPKVVPKTTKTKL